MSNARKNPRKTKPVQKPFLTGAPFDEHTFRNALLFFGGLIVTCLFTFIVSTMTAGFGSLPLRLVINIAIVFAVMVIYFNNGTNQGAEAVARGEILYQKQEKGAEVHASEKSVSFHKAKGFIIGVIGTLPLLLLTVLFAVLVQPKITGPGTLPSWMQAYTRRIDVWNALTSYTQPDSMAFVDYLRIAVRICIMPFVNIAGTHNNHSMLIIERLSPLLILFPAAAYGFGYLTGRSIRTKVHTAISVNERKRVRREKRRTERNANRHSGPEQLN